MGTLSAKQALFLATLDPDTDVTAVDLSSGMDELKRRLEILLGARPEAPIDESLKEVMEKEAQELARKQRIAKAGGQLLGAAFSFLSEMLPEKEETEQTVHLAETFRKRLSECLDRGEDGALRMTITIPDESVIENLARSLAKLANAA